jgi:acyl-CoA synthetase (NDP forming)
VIAPDRLLSECMPLGDGARLLVPEHLVKDHLARERGLRIPCGTVLDLHESSTGAASRVQDLCAPLVLKAIGPGIVHKTDVGAVRLGLSHDDLDAAIVAMTDALGAEGLVPQRFLVEEQVEPGIELMVGASRGPYGVTVAVGLGGTMAELLDDVAVRLAPLTRADAEALLDGFRSAPALRGARGSRAADREALVDLLLALAGADGLVADLGPWFAELDCNPVIARHDGAMVVDARLVLFADPPAPRAPGPAADFGALFAPRAIGIAGVSTSRPGFGNRAIAAYRAFGWAEGLSVIHPSAAEVDGVPAFPSVADLPGGLDYLLVAVPAAACADVVRQAAGHVRIVQVISGGFAEAGGDGVAHERALLEAARAAGVRVVGPNCIGVYAPAGRQTFLLDAPDEPGVVSVVSQSGGLAGDIVKAGAVRGLRFAKVLSLGNALDVTAAEVVEHLIADGVTRVVGCYLEGAGDGERLVRALCAARGRVPVVVMAGGLTGQGARAAVSHTGALTGDRRAWEAIRAATNVAVVERLEDFLGALVFAQRYAGHPAAGDPDVLVVGVGGGASVLATDACDRAGLRCTPVTAAAVERLRSLGYGAGTSVVNPIEIGVGPAAPTDVFQTVLDAVLPEQPVPDVLLHVNVAAYYGYGTSGTAPLCELIELLGASLAAARYPASRVVLVTRNLDVAPAADADAVRTAAATAGVPVFRTFDEAAVAIAAGKEFARGRERDA